MLRIRVPYAPPETDNFRVIRFFVLFCLVDVAGGCLDEVGYLVNLESLESLGSVRNSAQSRFPVGIENLKQIL